MATLAQTLYYRGLAAGGPGSGCHGPNCGRPSGTHVAIPKSTYPLTIREKKAEARFRAHIGRDPKAAMLEYKARFGNVLNADHAKELSKDYLKDRSLAAAVHEPASWLVKQLFQKALKTEDPEKINGVLFTAGHAGVGKTTAIEQDPNARQALQKWQVVYDGTMRPASSAIGKVQQALDAGKKVSTVFIYRDPVEAYREGVLGRASRQEQDHGSGRTVTVSEYAAQASSVQDSMKELVAKFGDNPNFAFSVLDNSYGRGGMQRSSLDSLPPAKSYDDIHRAVTSELEKMHNEGKISNKIYRASLGKQTQGRPKEVGI